MWWHTICLYLYLSVTVGDQVPVCLIVFMTSKSANTHLLQLFDKINIDQNKPIFITLILKTNKYLASDFYKSKASREPLLKTKRWRVNILMDHHKYNRTAQGLQQISLKPDFWLTRNKRKLDQNFTKRLLLVGQGILGHRAINRTIYGPGTKWDQTI